MSSQQPPAANAGQPAAGSTDTLPTLQDSPTLEPRARHPEAEADEAGDASQKPQYASITGGGGQTRRSDSLHRMRTASTVRSTKEPRDPALDLSLPYRTLTADANMDEYRVEVASGELPGPPRPDDSSKNYRLVAFEPNDPGNPKNWSKAMKWYCTFVVAITCFVVAFESSVITADIGAVAEEFDQSVQLTLASISLFVMGFGVGPMVFAPLSEIYGRRII